MKIVHLPSRHDTVLHVNLLLLVYMKCYCIESKIFKLEGDSDCAVYMDPIHFVDIL